jgi:hypothetical protein
MSWRTIERMDNGPMTPIIVRPGEGRSIDLGIFMMSVKATLAAPAYRLSR